MRWRSRRGMLELDLLLLPFVDEVFCSLHYYEQLVFIKLLEQEDPELLRWFSKKGRSEDAELQEMVEKVLKWARVV